MNKTSLEIFKSDEDFLKPENVNTENKKTLKEKYNLPPEATDAQLIASMALDSNNPEGVFSQIRFRLSNMNRGL